MFRATWRSLRAHKARMFLSGLAIVLGVAFVVGTFIFTDTLKGTFDDLFAGEVPDVVVTQTLEAGSDDGTGTVVSVVPDTVLDQIRALPGVALATGDVDVASVTLLDGSGTPIGGNGPPQLGFSYPEFPDDPQLSSVTIAEGRAPAAADEVVVDVHSAERGGFHLGDQIEVVTQGPRLSMVLVGTAQFGVSGGLAGATLTLFERSFAQQTFIGSDAWSEVSATAAAGTTPEVLRDEVASAIGPGYKVATGAEVRDDQAAQFATALGFINTFLLVFAAIALFVGTFLILNTFSMLVARRTKELALLRAIGASRRQVTQSVLGEALILGLIGGILGLALGLGVALGLRELLGLIGAELPPGKLVLAPRTVIVALVVGVGVTGLAAWVPARRAGRVPPVAAMRDDVALPARSLRVRAWLGSIVTIAGAGLLLAAALVEDLPARLPAAGLAALSLMVGVIILAPVVSHPVVAVLGAPVARSGAVGRLAVRNAQRDRRRTAATASAILIGLALVTGIGVLGASATSSIDALVDEVITADFIVQPASFVPFTTEVGDEIEKIPEVAVVSRVRQAPAVIDGQQFAVTGVDPDTIQSVQSLEVDPDALADGGIAVDTTTAADLGVGVGDTVVVTWGNGHRDSLALRGTYVGKQAFNGFVVSLTTMADAGLPEVDSLVYVKLADGAPTQQVRSELDAIQKAYPTVLIQDQTEFKESISGQINQLLNLVYALLGLSVIIAIVGVVNTLALSILERTRELGMLRAVGTLRRQVRTMIRWESIVISFFGAFTGLALGLALGVSLQRMLAASGITVLAIPWGLIVVVLVATAVIGVLAAVWPARRAANLDILEAIRTE